MIFLDYEFNKTKEKYVNLVSCVTYDDVKNEVIEWWLHNDKTRQKELAEYLEGNFLETIVGFACVAEARSFISLGLNPMEFNWNDLHIEWRQLTNHNDRLQIGNHYIDGKIVRIPKPRPKWQRRDGEEGSRKLTHSLVECTYKLTGQIRDTKEKDEVRDLIISCPESFTEEEKARILKYNRDDVIFLETIRNRMIEEYKRVLKDSDRKYLSGWMEKRGKYAALTAIRESNGYPINVEYVRNFTKAIDYILQDTQREINSFFPDIKPFTWKPKEHRFSFNTKAVKKWIIDNGYADKWHVTESYKKDLREAKKNKTEIDRSEYLALSLEAFEDKFPFKHSYPKDNFGAQIVRYLILKQNLNGFKSKKEKGKKNFWDFVGSDGRVRPYMNIFGAQSSRSQPGSTGFMFLKPAWMRAMVCPPKGKALAGIDFGSEEFFISALLSGDKNMIDAYLSGDVYLYFAKLAGAVPWEGKREDYEKERDLFKSTCLLEGSLIRVRGRGFIPVESIGKGDEVWDGSSWRNCDGSVYMGLKDVIPASGLIKTTEDHRILGEDNEWRECKIYKREETYKREVLEENSGGLCWPDYTWSEIWKMGNMLLRNKINKICNICKG